MNKKITCFYNSKKTIEASDIDDLCITWGQHLNNMF